MSRRGCASGYNRTMRTFSLGVLITGSLGDEGVDPGLLSTIATRIAALGADALFVATSMTNAIEPVTALAAVATSNDLVLGAVISLESGRNPAIVVKMATTLALLAPGRSAVIFETDRADDSPRLAEALEVAGSLRHDGPVRAGGAEFFVRDAYNEPRPAATDALGIGVIVDHVTPRLATACDLVIARAVERDPWSGYPKVVQLLGETMPVSSAGAPLVVQVDGNSVDHVVDVVAQVASRRR
jgi:hypothetical protein